jgi:predicted glycoside hydrolase/deacetylase ChbG (UPF0249 family)
MSKPKYLIVNADDFGQDKNVNLGVIQGHKNGILTSASIMSTADDAFYESIELSRRYPSLDVGVHLVLCSDSLRQSKPVSKVHKVESLTDGDGFFLSSPIGWYKLFTKQDYVNVAEIELRAQIERILSCGIKPSHLNSHYYLTTLFPKLFRLTLKLAKEYNIPAVRISSEQLRLLDLFSIHRSAVQKSLLLKIACRNYYKLIDNCSLLSSDYYLGVQDSEVLSEQILSKRLHQIMYGITELLVHPAIHDSKYFNEKAQFDALTSDKVKSLIKELNIVTTNFRALCQNRCV